MTERRKPNISADRSLSSGQFRVTEGFTVRLAEAMARAKTNQSRLTGRLHLRSASVVNEIVSGANPNPGEPTVRRIAEALGVSFGWLATGAEDDGISRAAASGASPEPGRVAARPLVPYGAPDVDELKTVGPHLGDLPHPEAKVVAGLVATHLTRALDAGMATAVVEAVRLTLIQREAHTEEGRRAASHFLAMLGDLVQPSKPNLASDLFRASSDVVTGRDRGNR
jgi:transcriptional regulator with XRE-family HTH domain